MENKEISIPVQNMLYRWHCITESVLELYKDIITTKQKKDGLSPKDKDILTQLEKACFELVNDIHLKH